MTDLELYILGFDEN